MLIRMPTIRREMGDFATRIAQNKRYMKMKDTGRYETWDEVADRIVYNIVRPYMPEFCDPIRQAIASRQLLPGGRYIYAAGLPYQQINNCALLRAYDSKEGWGNLSNETTNCLMTGFGVGADYSEIRPEGFIIHGMGGQCTGPISLMNIQNESGRHIMQGGSRRSALWAGLAWWHPDVFKFICCKDWSELHRYCKSKDFNFPAPMDGTNVSVLLDDDFFAAMSNPNWTKTYSKWGTTFTLTHSDAANIYWKCVKKMLKTGEPGLSVNIGEDSENTLRNACTELDSATHLDLCNLASLNLARISYIDDLYELTRLGMVLLLCGTLASKLPVPKMYEVREKNRRLGLGLMGIHAWLIQRGYNYDVNPELESWLRIYAKSGEFANEFADKLNISRPVATRSIAPNGTISIVGETTGGIEPIFAVTYKRRFLEKRTWKAQYIVDPTAKMLIEDYKINPESIEDSFTLADDTERRLRFQAFVQKYVDHGISSTLNLPEWNSSTNNEDTIKTFGKNFLKYLPNLRGMTTYPNGARDGQPLVRTPYFEALKRGIGVEFNDGNTNEENESKVYNEVAEGILGKEHLKNDTGGSDTVVDELQIPLGAMCKNGICGE